MTPEMDFEAGGTSNKHDERLFVPALVVVDMQEDFCPPVSPCLDGWP